MRLRRAAPPFSSRSSSDGAAVVVGPIDVGDARGRINFPPPLTFLLFFSLFIACPLIFESFYQLRLTIIDIYFISIDSYCFK